MKKMIAALVLLVAGICGAVVGAPSSGAVGVPQAAVSPIAVDIHAAASTSEGVRNFFAPVIVEGVPWLPTCYLFPAMCPKCFPAKCPNWRPHS